MASNNPYRESTVSIRYSNDIVFIRIGSEICTELDFRRLGTIEIVKLSKTQWILKKAPIEFLGCRIPSHYVGRFVCLKARGKQQLEVMFTCRHVSLRSLSSNLMVITHEIKADCLLIDLGK